MIVRTINRMGILSLVLLKNYRNRSSNHRLFMGSYFNQVNELGN